MMMMMISLWSAVSAEKADASSELTTDRMIVAILDSEGTETVESISQADLENFNEGTLLDKSSILYNAQKVEVIEPDFIRSIALEAPVSSKEIAWGTYRVGVNKLKDSLASVDRTVIIATIDTGVDYTHPFLKGRIIKGYDVIANDTDAMDVHFHGTHVAGIIAETTPANVKIMPIRALDEEGNGYDSDMATGIRYAVDHGADIINMSFVGEGYSQYLADAINYALSKNVLVVVAAGNDSANTDLYYPASEQKVIVVSATDKEDRIASFSNTGAAIDVSAPGVNIVSTIPGGHFKSLSGTSMAAPYVSGIAAMLKLEQPTRSRQGLERLIKKYVDDRGPVGWDSQYGEGIVNVSSLGGEETAVKLPTDLIRLPSYKGVPLDKKWMIEFNRQLTERDTIDVKVFMDNKEVPIQVTPIAGKKEIVVSADKLYLPNTAYRLVIQSGKKNKYEMHFMTVLN